MKGTGYKFEINLDYPTISSTGGRSDEQENPIVLEQPSKVLRSIYLTFHILPLT